MGKAVYVGCVFLVVGVIALAAGGLSTIGYWMLFTAAVNFSIAGYNSWVSYRVSKQEKEARRRDRELRRLEREQGTRT